MTKRVTENFDITIYMRYRPIISAIKNISDKNTKICEIGSGSFGIGPYLKKTFTGVDLNFSDNKSKYLLPVESSALNLPSGWTNKFDFVLSVDMLEHLPEEQREKAVGEMIRISNNYVVLAFPAGICAKLTDWLLDKYYYLTHGQRYPFLKEHRQYSLPNVLGFKKWLVRHPDVSEVKVKNNTSFFVYLNLLFLGFSQVGVLTRIYRLSYFVRRFLAKFNFIPYRKILFVKLKNGGKSE